MFLSASSSYWSGWVTSSTKYSSSKHSWRVHPESEVLKLIEDMSWHSFESDMSSAKASRMSSRRSRLRHFIFGSCATWKEKKNYIKKDGKNKSSNSKLSKVSASFTRICSFLKIYLLQGLILTANHFSDRKQTSVHRKITPSTMLII